MTQTRIDLLLQKLTDQLHTFLQQRHLENPAMVGIHTGGAWIAQQLHQSLKLEQPLGFLDITFYRDDFSHKGLHPNVSSSELPFMTENQHILLVDDVIMSGRTIRAAMNELFDYGRPASVTLITLLSLPGRELPIQPDIVAEELDLSPNQRVKLLGPDPLSLEIIQVD